MVDNTTGHPGPTILVIFGAGGDLTWRKLMPALYNLNVDGWIPEHFAVIGVDMKPMTLDEFRQRMLDGINNFSRRGKVDGQFWNAFSSGLVDYIVQDFDDPATYNTIKARIANLEKEWQAQAVHIYYQATPPSTVFDLVQQLGAADLAKDREHDRIVIEKPFGHDLESARALNKELLKVFEERQIYRIDHYLGKETVQNILAFRFANSMFEPIWNRRYIDHVQITVAEQVGVEHRGKYYEQAGALRDMLQNHLMQLFNLTAMEPPTSFAADEIRNRKVDVLHATRIIDVDEAYSYAARGQYGPGWIEGARVPGYHEEPGVSPDSTTETFAACKLYVDNWRWQGVPFYLRTGKRLAERYSLIYIQFRPVPHQSFPPGALSTVRPNSLTVHIQPEEGVRLHFEAKRPGQQWRLSLVDMHFNYQDEFEVQIPDAYETLLRDIMVGDMTLFKRDDQIEASWQICMPILDAWETNPPDTFPNYPAGSRGPESAEVLIAQDGRSWIEPSILEVHRPPSSILEERKKVG